MRSAYPQASGQSPRENHLLRALPAEDYERLRPYLELVALTSGQVLYESGCRLHHFYFPVSGVVSMLHILEDGHTGEIALLGNDGFVGISLLLGGNTTPNRKIVQVPGYAYRIPTAIVLHEFHRGKALHDLLLRYVQGFITQMAQTAVCNRHHALEQQLCRWLLMSLDRLGGAEVHMTQELISHMLGVQRTGITAAATRLARAGLIENRRGLIRVRDRAKLESHACECYVAVRKELQRLGVT